VDNASKIELKLGFDRIRQSISDLCITDYAAKRVEEEEFCTKADEISLRLKLTDEMKVVLMFEENFPTSGYIDAMDFLTPLQESNSHIDVLSLGKLKTLMDTTRRISAFFGSIKDGIYPNLKNLSRPIVSYPEVLRRIENIIDKYGEVKDSASPDLQDLRRKLKAAESSLSKKANAILKAAQDAGYADADAGVSIRDGKYLVPVSSANKRKVPGYVYDTSATGKTSFVEPLEVIELENEIIDLKAKEAREIEKILIAFSDFLRPYVPDLLKTAAFVGELDFIMAKARTSMRYMAGMPIISEDGSMRLRKARHPLLEKALAKEGKKMVPISLELSPAKHILLISGPNAGGKSVCLKTAGLLQYMFQWGMLIPTSETSELPVFEKIMISIGDDQNLENDLSTYSSFLMEMKNMLSKADNKTMVLIDEFGSGTEPAAGGAIAEAILAKLDERGVYGIITTHYTNLKLYASGAATGVVNGAMQFDAARIQPLFKLEMGLPGNSFAFEMARKTGLPENIVKDAEVRAGEKYVGIERNLRRIARNRRVLDEKIKKVKSTDKELSSLTEEYQKELESLQKERKHILEAARREAEEIIKGAGSRVERTIKEIKESQADKARTKAARSELQNFLGAIEQKKTKDEYIEKKMAGLQKKAVKKGVKAAPEQVVRKNEPLKIGEKARVIASGMVGEVAKVSAKSLTLIIGNISATMAPEDVERISSNEFKEAAKHSSERPRQRYDAAVSKRKLDFKPELDVRGERLNDALYIVMHYIDDAIMVGVPSVRIIHGKGTGALREEIQKYLKSVGGVVSFADEDVRHGGSGVTVVNFE